MKRNLKFLSRALAAIFMVGAVVASAAMANKEHQFKAGATPTVLTGQQHEGKPKFTIGAGSNEHITECEGTTLEGTEVGIEKTS